MMEFDKEIYSEAALRQAVEDYRDYADIEVTDTGRTWICRFFQCAYGEALIQREFANYALELTVQRKK